MHEEERHWFIYQINHFIYRHLKINLAYVKQTAVFYNKAAQSCIVRLQFDQQHTGDMENYFFYFRITFRDAEQVQYGKEFEQSLLDKNNTITLIQDNELLVFYPQPELLR